MTGYRLPVMGKNMKYVRPYKTLDVYTVGKALVMRVYALLQTFPKEEQYALCDQLRRAVISVPSNVAEGLGRTSEKEQLRFIEIAYGSLMEVETQLDIACDLGYVTPEAIDDIMELIDREARLLSGLRSHRLQSADHPSPVTGNRSGSRNPSSVTRNRSKNPVTRNL